MIESQNTCLVDKTKLMVQRAREHVARGELQIAEHLSRRALEVAPAGSEPAREARRVLALSRSLGGDLEGALALCDPSDDDEATSLRRLILFEWGDVRRAAECADGRNSGDKAAQFVAALLDFEAGDLARCLSRALKLARHEDPETSARGHILLSRLALAQGGVRHAADMGRRAVQLADPLVSRGARIAARFAQSYAEESLGFPHRARRSIESALGHARRAGDRPAQVRAHLRLSELAALEHDSAAAMAHAGGALSMIPPRAPTPLRPEAVLRAAVASRQLAMAMATGLGWVDDGGAAAAAASLRAQAADELARIDHEPLGLLAVLHAELELEWGALEIATALVDRWSDAGVPCADLALDQPASGSCSALALPIARLAVRLRRGADALAALELTPPSVRASDAARAIRALALRQTGRLTEALTSVGGQMPPRTNAFDLDGSKRSRKAGGFASSSRAPEPAGSHPLVEPRPGIESHRVDGDRVEPDTLREFGSGDMDGATRSAMPRSGHQLGQTDPEPSTSALLASDDDDGLPRRTSPPVPRCRRRRDRRRQTVGPVSDLSHERARRMRYSEILLLRVRECLLREQGHRLEAQRCLLRWMNAARGEPGRAMAMLDRFGLAGEPTLRLVLGNAEVVLSREECDLLLPGRHVDVLLDVNRRILHRPDGTQVQLDGQPKMFEAFEFLFRNVGKDLTRQRFFEAMWGNAHHRWDQFAHEQKVIKTLQRLSALVGRSFDGRDVLRFSRESEIGFDAGLRVGLLESVRPNTSPLGLRAARILRELETGPRSAAELSLLIGLEQGRLMLELAELIRRTEIERIGHGRGVTYRQVARPDRISLKKAA